jgi:hypothetical protein
MDKKIFQPEKYGMVICQGVTAKDIFKIQNASVAQSAEALGSLERKRKKTRIVPPIVINCQGYLSDSFL